MTNEPINEQALKCILGLNAVIKKVAWYVIVICMQLLVRFLNFPFKEMGEINFVCA